MSDANETMKKIVGGLTASVVETEDAFIFQTLSYKAFKYKGA